MSTVNLDDTVIIVPNAGLGHAEPALGVRVLGNYFRTLTELSARPRAICFYTAGVKMVADDSPLLAELRTLAQAGVQLVSCRTCLEHYGLIDRVAVGEVGSIAQVIELQAAAAKVITL
jgi:intracellular sulfur oxidation DsrE/DsrF family protein